MKKIKIYSHYEGRLDSTISEQLSNKFSRNYIQNLIKNGKVTINGKFLTKPSKIIKSNVEIVINNHNFGPNKKINNFIDTNNFNINILYEDPYLAVIDKPAFISMHGGSGNRSFTISDIIQKKWPTIINVGEENRRGIVHRLDKETSGVVIVALREISYIKLVEMMKNRIVKKSYYALVNGHPKNMKGIVEAPIGRNPKNRTKQDIILGGKHAITEYQIIKTYDNFSLLDINLQTGRTHQIRVHMKAIGHPVVGDKKYNNTTHKIKRQFLHAYNIKFKHPINDKIIDINSEIPPDLNNFLENISEA